MGRPAPRSQRANALIGIADALAVFLGKRGGAEHTRLTQLWEHWNMVMGDDLASLASPLGHKKGTLLLAAEDPMAAQDLAMQSVEILERANAFMNERYFSRVQVELAMGRKNLSHALPPLRPKPQDYHVPRPKNLGSLKDTLPLDSPIRRCYEAYLRYFSHRQN